MAKKTSPVKAQEIPSNESENSSKFSFEKVKEMVDEFSGMDPVLGINAVDKVITLRYTKHLSLPDIRTIVDEAQRVFGVTYQGWKISLSVLDKKYMTLL